jgi:hypothetical protein
MIGYGMSEDEDLEGEDPAFIEMVKKAIAFGDL